jgi:hypothetical protein
MASTLVNCASCGLKTSPDRTVCSQCGVDLGTLTIPLHLAPLLLPTPSSVAKLVAAWDGLSTESQILILTKFKTTTRPAYLSERIRIKALDSANAYVRYLAASSFGASGDDVLKKRIEQDTDALVRYCLLETPETGFVFGDSDMLKDADTFFALRHEARLAVVRRMNKGGKQLASVIAHAFDHQLKEAAVSEIELFEILCDYVNKPLFREYYASQDAHDGYPLSELSDIGALWELVPKLPEAISYVLIENLPAAIAREPAIPNEVLKKLNPRQIYKLLSRADVGLEQFRKDTFWGCKAGDLMTTAATSHNFNLDCTEFARILEKPKEEQVEILHDLFSSQDLSPYLYEAVFHFLIAKDENARDLPWLRTPGDKVEERLTRPEGVAFGELVELGLYRAADAWSTWLSYPRQVELEFLSKYVVQSDTWGTFTAFLEAWHKETWSEDKPYSRAVGRLLEYLPQWKLREEDEGPYRELLEKAQKPHPPVDPEVLFGDEGREDNFLEDKIDFIGRKLLSLSQIPKETEEIGLSEDPDELIGEKEERESLEEKIDFINTKLTFYENKFDTFVKNLKYNVWTAIIVGAILYGWKSLASLF